MVNRNNSPGEAANAFLPDNPDTGLARPLRLGNFQHGFPEPDGTTTAVRGLCRALAARGHHVTIYGCGQGDARQEMRPGLCVRLFRRTAKNPFTLPRELIRCLRTNEDRLDLLILNSMFHPANVAVARAARHAGIRYIVCPHDPYHALLLRKNRLRKAVYGFLFEKPLLRRAAAVQLLSPSHERHLRAFGIGVPAITVPNGFEEDPPAAAWPEAPLEGDPALLVLGRVDAAQKGHDLLIRALALMRLRGTLPPRLKVHIVGPMDDAGREMIRLAEGSGAGAFIQFHGRVPDAERWRMLRSCDALLLCSRYDGFGLVVLEAMLSEKPVLVSAEAGVVDWVRDAHCGFDFEPDPVSIASTLERALDAFSEWRRMGRRGRDFARRHMTWNRMAELAERRYAALLEPAVAARPAN